MPTVGTGRGGASTRTICDSSASGALRPSAYRRRSRKLPNTMIRGGIAVFVGVIASFSPSGRLRPTGNDSDPNRSASARPPGQSRLLPLSLPAPSITPSLSPSYDFTRRTQNASSVSSVSGVLCLAPPSQHLFGAGAVPTAWVLIFKRRAPLGVPLGAKMAIHCRVPARSIPGRILGRCHHPESGSDCSGSLLWRAVAGVTSSIPAPPGSHGQRGSGSPGERVQYRYEPFSSLGILPDRSSSPSQR